ncbi:MAG: HAD family phosphatase [Candidatus Cloacimonetes bacterium]|nr:HAD family phosphatase [Candidatus Cloacimonadota bacterium]
MQEHTIRAVIFDMDGVLLDSEPLYYDIQQELFRSLGFEVSEEEYGHFIGLTMESMWQKLKETHGLKQSVPQLIKQNNKAILKAFRHRDHFIPIPFLLDYMHQLQSEGKVLAVASSTAKEIITIILEKLGLTFYFQEVVSGEEVPAGKPAPDIFLETACRLGLEPAECLVIEDSANGVSAAKAAGMQCLGFAYSLFGDQDLSAADKVVSGYDELLEEL